MSTPESSSLPHSGRDALYGIKFWVLRPCWLCSASADVMLGCVYAAVLVGTTSIAEVQVVSVWGG